VNVSADFLPRNCRLSADRATLTLRKMCKRSLDDLDCSLETDSGPTVIQCNASNEHGYVFANGYVNVLGIGLLILYAIGLAIARPLCHVHDYRQTHRSPRSSINCFNENKKSYSTEGGQEMMPPPGLQICLRHHVTFDLLTMPLTPGLDHWCQFASIATFVFNIYLQVW